MRASRREREKKQRKRKRESERAQREREGCDDNFSVQHRAENPEKPLKEHLHFTRHCLALLSTSSEKLHGIDSVQSKQIGVHI